MPKFIFVTGGVVSSVGKGITAACLGRMLKSSGISVSIQKLDPYINVDPGTMSPYQHGEVFVTDDGAETDLDLGHYERFIDEDLTHASNVTTGHIYRAVIERERRGDFLGGTIQASPTSPTKSSRASRPWPARAHPTWSSWRSAARSATSRATPSWKPSARCAAKRAAKTSSTSTSPSFR